jgi:hypothetical protein
MLFRNICCKLISPLLKLKSVGGLHVSLSDWLYRFFEIFCATKFLSLILLFEILCCKVRATFVLNPAGNENGRLHRLDIPPEPDVSVRLRRTLGILQVYNCLASNKRLSAKAY